MNGMAKFQFTYQEMVIIRQNMGSGCYLSGQGSYREPM